jgi:hypothetical protein
VRCEKGPEIGVDSSTSNRKLDRNMTCFVHVKGRGAASKYGFFVGVKYGGYFVGPKAAKLPVKAL